MRSKSLLSVLATVMIVVSVIAPVLLIGGVAKAQGTIVLSSPNLNPYKAIELDIRLPGVDVPEVTLRLYVDGAFRRDFSAGKLATGRYIAYLVGPEADLANPANPKVSRDYCYRVNIDPTETATLTVEVLGYDVAIDIPFKPVATSLTIDRTKIPARGDLWDSYEVTLSITDQDLNFDPTAIDTPDLEYLYMYLTLIKRETTGETFENKVDLTTLEKELSETSANSGVFKLTLTAREILDLLGVNKFDKGDLLIIEVASNIPTNWGNDYTLSDSKNIDVVYTYPEVSVSFTNQAVIITINSPDDNIKTGVKDNLAGDVAVEVDGKKYTIDGTKFMETGANTGVFKYTLKVKWGDETDIDEEKDYVILGTGKSSFKVEATYLDITGSARYVPVEPKIIVEKATVRSIVLNVEDKDLNNDPKTLELLRLDGITDTNVISFTKDGVLLYKVTLMDSAGKPLTIPEGYSPSFFEAGLDSNIFKLTLPAVHDKTQIFKAGETYIVKIVDYTGPEYTKTITVTVAEIKVELDRNIYPINIEKKVKVHVTLYDDRLNLSPIAIDRPVDALTYYVFNPTTGKYINPDTGETSDNKVPVGIEEIVETGPDTGIFTATIEIEPGVMSRAWIGAKIVVYRTGEERFKAEAKFDVYQVAPGDLSVDKTIVPINGTITITLNDPDANVDSEEEDVAAVTVYVDGVDKGTIELSETDVNTGKFIIIISPAYIGGAEPGSTIRFEYVDRTPTRSPTTTKVDFGTPVKISVTVNVASHTGTLTVPKDWIGPYEIMTIRVVDPDLNRDPLMAEEIEEAVKVTVEGEIDVKPLTLYETGVNTGIFEGDFSLGWWETGNVEEIIPVETIREKGYIGKKIMILYEDSIDETGRKRINVASLVVKAVDAKILVDRDAVNLGETLVITIENLDIARNPNVELRKIVIRSTTYPIGITFYASEVEPGIYQVKVTPVSLEDWVVGAPQIPAKLGDTLTIEYVDPIATDGTKKLFTKTVIVGVPIERPVPASVVKFADPITGAEKTAGKIGEMILLQATVKNVDVVEKTCTVVIKVKDAAGATIYIGTAIATLAPGQEFAPGITWVPTLAGDYIIEVLVVKSLAEPTPYSDKITAPLTVTA